MLAHSQLGPLRDDRTLKEALAEYERIEHEDLPAMRLDEKAHTSQKARGQRARECAVRPEPRTARTSPRDRRASPYRKPRRTLPAGLSGYRRRAMAARDAIGAGCRRHARVSRRSGETGATPGRVTDGPHAIHPTGEAGHARNRVPRPRCLAEAVEWG